MPDLRPDEIDNTKYQFTADHDYAGSEVLNVGKWTDDTGRTVWDSSVPNTVINLADEGYEGGSKDLHEAVDAHGYDVTYILPEGTYTMSEGIIKESNFGRVAFIGQPHATIDVVDNTSEQAFSLGSNVDACESVVLRNITVDIEGTDSDGIDIDRALFQARVSDFAYVENVHLQGARHRYQDTEGDSTLETVGDRETFKINVVNADSTAYVRNLTMPDGGTFESSQSQVGHAIGVASGGSQNSLGDVIYDGCHVEGFIDNGFYAKNDDNRTILRNCFAKNNANSNFRLGNNDRMENCECVIDSDPDGLAETGLYIDNATNAVVDGFVIDVTVDVSDVIRTANAENCTLRNFDVSFSSSDRIELRTTGNGMLLENWDVENTGGNSAYNETILVDGDRVTLRNVDINDSNGYPIRVYGSKCKIEDCILRAGAYAIVIGDSGGASNTFGDLWIDGTDFVNDTGIFLYSNETVTNFRLTDNDFSAVSSPLADINGTVTKYVRDGNRGLSDTSLLSTFGGEVVADDEQTYDTVQAAVDAATDYVRVGSGTFSETVTVSTAGLTIEGMDMDVTTVDGGTTSHAIQISADNVTVKDLAVQTTAGGGNVFDGVRVDEAITGARIERVKVVDSDAVGIRIFDDGTASGTHKNHLVTGCDIEASDGHGIRVNFSHEATKIENCKIRDGVGGDGISISSDQNSVTDCMVDGVTGTGIFQSGDDGTVIGCSVFNSGNDGVSLHDTNQVVVGCRIGGSTNTDLDTSGATTPTTAGNNTGSLS